MTDIENYRLIALMLLVSCVAILINIHIVSRLFRTENHIKDRLLIVGAIIIGSGLICAHFIDLLVIPPIKNMVMGYTVGSLIASWVVAILTAGVVTYVSSQKSLPLKPLIFGSSIGSLGGYTLYYFSIQGMEIVRTVAFKPSMIFLALAIGLVVFALYIIVLFWLKNHVSPYSAAIKVAFSIIATLGLTSAHISYNNTFDTSTTAISGSSTTLLGISLALGCLCLFCIAFIIAIFYDKLHHNTFRYNLVKTEAPSDLSRLALIDSLTKLPNRRALKQNLEAGSRRCARNNTSMAVAFIDLDSFKPINDNYGHQVGDELLIRVANRLNTAVRNCDVVTRIGGDEFVALLEDIKSNEDIVPILERIVQTINEVFLVNGHQLFISASVGAAVFPKDGNLEQLISCADAAMYRAKSDGKNQFRFFDSEIELASDYMLDMQKDLKNALANNEFKLQFQLKFDSSMQTPVGAEALLRWNHPKKGLMLPHSFIDEAERFGLIGEIGNWVIEESCRTLHRMRQHNIDLNISVNLSPQQLRNTKLANEVKEMLDRFDLPNSSIKFEISEATAIKYSDLMSSLLADFSQLGIKIAIDNFGSNPFNLAYLKNLNIAELKLDKQLTLDIHTNDETHAIVEAIIRLAHALQLSVTAEGVEFEEQRKMLSQLGCDQMQGHLLSRPLTEIKLVEMIKELDSSFVIDGNQLVKGYLRSINNSKN